MLGRKKIAKSLKQSPVKMKQIKQQIKKTAKMQRPSAPAKKKGPVPNLPGVIMKKQQPSRNKISPVIPRRRPKPVYSVKPIFH